MVKIYSNLDRLNFKEMRSKLGSFHPLLIYYEIWFMFMDEIIHIQKDLIDDFKCFDQPLKIDEIVYKIKLLLKPKIIKSETDKIGFNPPQIKLFVPDVIYNRF